MVDESVVEEKKEISSSAKLDEALEYVLTKKRGQKRWISTLPELCHSAEVLKKAWVLGEKDESVLCAAVLHDLNPSDEIQEKFGTKCNGLLGHLCRRDREKDESYVNRIMGGTPEVKLLVACDLFTDISDASVAGALGQARGYFQMMGKFLQSLMSDATFDRSFREMITREVKFWERKLRVAIHK